MPQLIPIGAMTGLSALLGGLNNRSKTVRTTSTMNPVFTPEQAGLQTDSINLLRSIVSNPSAGLEPMRTAAAGSINRMYAGAPQKIAEQMSKRGFGKSGQLGTNLQALEMGRIGDIAGVNSDFADLTSKRQLEGASLGERLLASLSGRETSGTEVLPGNVLGGSLSGGIGTLGMILGADAASQMNGVGPINWGRVFGIGRKSTPSYNVPVSMDPRVSIPWAGGGTDTDGWYGG